MHIRRVGFTHLIPLRRLLILLQSATVLDSRLTLGLWALLRTYHIAHSIFCTYLSPIDSSELVVVASAFNVQQTLESKMSTVQALQV